jgi:hypothetical protein
MDLSFNLGDTQRLKVESRIYHLLRHLDTDGVKFFVKFGNKPMVVVGKYGNKFDSFVVKNLSRNAHIVLEALK